MAFLNALFISLDSKQIAYVMVHCNPYNEIVIPHVLPTSLPSGTEHDRDKQ